MVAYVNTRKNYYLGIVTVTAMAAPIAMVICAGIFLPEGLAQGQFIVQSFIAIGVLLAIAVGLRVVYYFGVGKALELVDAMLTPSDKTVYSRVARNHNLMIH